MSIKENGFPLGTRPVLATWISGKPHGIVREATRQSEARDSKNWRPFMCCMGEHGSRVSIAFSVWCLINDYHSPMDSIKRYEDWRAVY